MASVEPESAAAASTATCGSAGSGNDATAYCSAEVAIVSSSTTAATTPAITSTVRAESRAQRTTTTPRHAYSVRMSPYQTSRPCASPIASIRPSRRAPGAQRARPDDSARPACIASPKPNSIENSEMNLKEQNASTTLHAMASAVVTSMPGTCTVGSIADPSGVKKNRVLTSRMPSSATPRAMSTPRMRSPEAMGASDGASGDVVSSAMPARYLAAPMATSSRALRW